MVACIVVLALAIWFVGVFLAEHELRLRHHGYAYRLTEDGKVDQYENDLEWDIESMQWAPSVFSWLIYVPYRLYRIKHPVPTPLAEELGGMYSVVP